MKVLLLALSGRLLLLTVRDDGDVGRIYVAPGLEERRVAARALLDGEPSLERLGGEWRVRDAPNRTERGGDPVGLARFFFRT